MHALEMQNDVDATQLFVDGKETSVVKTRNQLLDARRLVMCLSRCIIYWDVKTSTGDCITKLTAATKAAWEVERDDCGKNVDIITKH